LEAPFSPDGASVAIAADDNSYRLDGDPERDGIGTDTTLRYGNPPPSRLFIVTDSSGNGNASNPPAEGFAVQWPPYGHIRITGTGPGTYMLAGMAIGGPLPRACRPAVLRDRMTRL
jgi:hypothetical protein